MFINTNIVKKNLNCSFRDISFYCKMAIGTLVISSTEMLYNILVHIYPKYPTGKTSLRREQNCFELFFVWVRLQVFISNVWINLLHRPRWTLLAEYLLKYNKPILNKILKVHLKEKTSWKVRKQDGRTVKWWNWALLKKCTCNVLHNNLVILFIVLNSYNFTLSYCWPIIFHLYKLRQYNTCYVHNYKFIKIVEF